MKLLEDMGIEEWVRDTVIAKGQCATLGTINEANLAFNYTAISGKELEVLEYTVGANWMQGKAPTVSHLGMHCTEEELKRWRPFFSERNIQVAQEVNTMAHTNEAIKDSRRYNYVIFDTRAILGTDIKFIVRKPVP